MPISGTKPFTIQSLELGCANGAFHKCGEAGPNIPAKSGCPPYGNGADLFLTMGRNREMVILDYKEEMGLSPKP